MNNQQLMDGIEFSLPKMPIDLRVKICDAIWLAITNNREEPKDEY